jgi:hypothetical protein
MDMSKTIESKYLKASDLQGRTVKFVIDSVSMEDLSQENKPPEIKACVKLRDRTKAWVLNRTNTESLIKFFGAESNDWAGKEVELFAVAVQVNGESKEGIRCKLPTGDFEDDLDI